MASRVSTSGDVPAITTPQLYARKKLPTEAFAKFDAKQTGKVGVEDMRQSFATLGIKLGLTEAKAMIAKQTGDKAGAMNTLQFDYREFLRSQGAEVTRADAAAQRFATEADRSHIDIHNPPPQPSAASLIVERLRRERGPIAEGYVMSVTSGDQAKQRPQDDATFSKSEIDKLGGLNKYLSEDHVEKAADGYLPRLPGQEHAKRFVDDKLFRAGEFTNTVLSSRGGISAWNDDKEGKGAAAMPEGYDALPGQEPHRKVHDDLHFGGELKRVGGIGQFLDDHFTEAQVPDGYVYRFPGDPNPRRIKIDPMHAGGEIASRGGLLPFLADMKTDMEIPEEGYLPLQAGEQFAKKKQYDPLHHGGELLKTGIGAYIADKSGAGMEGYIQSVTSMYAKKQTPEDAFINGSLESSSHESRILGPSRPGQKSAVDQDDVPVMPADIRVNASDIDSAFHRARAIANNRDAYNLLGPASEIDTVGGLSGFLASSDPKAKEPVPIQNSAIRYVGHISKAGGIGGYVGKPTANVAPTEGYLAPLPGQEWAHQKEKLPDCVTGALDRSGGLGAFLTSGGVDANGVPSGYLMPLAGGEMPKKKADLDKSMIGALDKYGGLAGFYANHPQADAPAGYLPVMPGQEFGHMDSSATSLQRRGKLEKAGLGDFMFGKIDVPEGFVAPLPGQNDDNFRQVLFAGDHNKGMLEKNGGISGWMKNAEKVGEGMQGYVLYPGEAVKRAGADPLHMYSTIGAEAGGAFALEVNSKYDVSSIGLEHKREAKMVGSRLITATSEKAPEAEHVRTAHLVKDKIVESTHDQVEISSHSREQAIRSGHIGNSVQREEDSMNQAVIVRETSLRQIALDRAAEAHKIREEAEREVMERAGLLPPPTPSTSASTSNNNYNNNNNNSSTVPSRSASISGPDNSSYSTASSVIGGSGGLYSHARSAVGEQATDTLRKAMAASSLSSSPTSAAAGTSSYANRYNTSKQAAGSSSPSAIAAIASIPAIQMDVRRLARIRKAIRDVLPKKGGAAVSLLRQRLHKEDGDGDGVVSDMELLRGLTTLNPGLTASDVGFIVKYMRSKAKHVEENFLPEGFSNNANYSTSVGSTTGIDLDAIAEWVTRQPGGVESGKYGGGNGKNEDGTESLPDETNAPTGPQVYNDRITWNSRAQKFVAFRAHWEERHGSAAQREIAADLAAGSEGPTWTRADPQPFKVLHMVGGPPPASK